MNKHQASITVNRLYSRAYVSASDISAWLLDSKVQFKRPRRYSGRTKLPLQVYMKEAEDALENYDGAIENFCYAIGYLWNADRQVARSIIENLMARLNYTYLTTDYSIMCTKLSVLILLSEI